MSLMKLPTNSFLVVILLNPCFWIMISCMRPATDYEGYGYLIIAPERVMSAVADFAAYKESKGFNVETVLLEEVLETSGQDDPEKVRNYLSNYATRKEGREFVLLVGSMETMPMRLTYPSPLKHYSSSAVPTDFYYEELTGNWDADGDGYFGEYGDDLSLGTEDYRAEVWVGRIPWDDEAQIQAICETIRLYEEENTGRMTQAMVGGATIESQCDSAIGINAANDFIFRPSGYKMTRLYEDCPLAGSDFELTNDTFVEQWEALQPGLVIWFSHQRKGDKKRGQIYFLVRWRWCYRDSKSVPFYIAL